MESSIQSAGQERDLSHYSELGLTCIWVTAETTKVTHRGIDQVRRGEEKVSQRTQQIRKPGVWSNESQRKRMFSKGGGGGNVSSFIWQQEDISNLDKRYVLESYGRDSVKL